MKSAKTTKRVFHYPYGAEGEVHERYGKKNKLLPTGNIGFSAASLVLLCLIFLFGILRPIAVFAEETSPRTVKVGWYQSDCFQEGTSDGEKKGGYCYEYLQKVADYTEWSYEYVYGGWTDLFAMLENGEIDVLAGVSLTEERRKTMLFPDYAMGSDIYCLYKRLDNTNIVSGDSSTINGKKIGGITNNRMTLFAEEWAEANNLNVEFVYYKSFEELDAAFENREVDLMTGTQNNVLRLDNISIVAKVGEEPYYLAVNAERQDLLSELNESLSLQQEMDPYLLQNLQYANYGATVVNRTLTSREQQWVDTHDTLLVGYLNDYAPFCNKGDDGNPTGIMIEVLERLWNELGFVDKIKIEYCSFDNYAELEKALTTGQVDVIMPISMELWYLENAGIDSTSAVVTCNENLIFNGRKDRNSIKTLAVNENNKMQILFCETNYPEAELIYYPNIKECLDAVVKESVDGTILNGYRTIMVTGSRAYKALSYIPVPGETARCFGVSHTDSALILLLNRGLKLVGTDYGAGIANKYVSELFSYTSRDFIEDNIIVIFLAVLFIVLVVIFVLIRNVAVHKKYEAKLEKAKMDAETANKAKTAFLFNMSHDIRTPMNAIIGFRDLLEKHQEDPEKREDYLKKLEESSNILLSIINNVLEMARIEKGTIEIEESAWSAEQLTDTICSVFQEMMTQKGITFTKQVMVQHPYIYCDQIKMREVFINILSNAYKYTNSGGSVKVLVEELPSERAGYVVYQTTVADTGVGMSAEFLPHIFEEFSRENTSTENKIEGTGLGMPIVKRLVEFMDGTIEVRSEKGVGSTFIVKIPHKIAEEAVLQERVEVEGKPTLFKGKRILMAEDNDLNAEIAREILGEAGFIIDRAEDGAICCQKLSEAEDHYYNLVLMDIQMPNMNGYEAARTIRRMQNYTKSSIPIVAMTANAFEEDKKDAIKAGMNGHLAKPIDVEELMKELTRILG